MQGPSTSAGSGNNQYSASCPAGQVMTGVQVGVYDGKLSGYANIRCKPPKSIDSAGSGAQYNVGGSPAARGTNVIFECPTGFALNQFNPRRGGSNIEGLQFGCARFADNAGPTLGPILGKDNAISQWTAPPRNFMIGVAGMAGDKNLNMVTPLYADFTKSIGQVYTPQGIADGCMGIGDPNSWKYQPGSGDCDSFMVRTYCQQNPSDPRCSCVTSEMSCPNKFDQNCIKNNGYRTNDMKTVTCPDVMNCIQYNRLSPGAKALATNFQQNCSTSTTVGGETTNENTTNEEGSSSAWLWITLVVLFIIITIVAGLVIYKVSGSGSTTGAGDDAPGVTKEPEPHA